MRRFFGKIRVRIEGIKGTRTTGRVSAFSIAVLVGECAGKLLLLLLNEYCEILWYLLFLLELALGRELIPC
jgi:hypothetical protein